MRYFLLTVSNESLCNRYVGKIYSLCGLYSRMLT